MPKVPVCPPPVPPLRLQRLGLGTGLRVGDLAAHGLFGLERLANGFVLEPVGLDLFQQLDFGERVLAALVEGGPRRLGGSLDIGEIVLLVLDFAHEHVELIEVVGRRLVHDVDQHIDLGLITDVAEPGEQWQRAGAGTGEAVDRHCLDVSSKLIDLLLQRGDLGLQALLGELQRVELRLGLEQGIGGSVGPVASVGDLLRRLLGGRVVGVTGGRHQGRRNHSRQQHDESHHDRSPSTHVRP
ncbi:MAG: hypothetical protein FD127_3254, partial [Acidimicrobiaceae bacterium]